MLYAILDTGLLRAITGEAGLVAALDACTQSLTSAQVPYIQLRAKEDSPRLTLTYAATIKAAASSPARLILNDRPDLALLADFNGCHLGQDDISLEAARRILRAPATLGISTHNAQQLAASNQSPADYIAIGPIFATGTKQNPDPVVGLDQLRQLRALTSKPLVAIGGITRDNAASVLNAGADYVAIIGDLLRGATSAAGLPAVFERNLADILRAIR